MPLDCSPSSPRYERHLALIGGPEGQEQLSRTTIAIVGLGGLGSIVSQYLAAAGVGRLVLVDPDIVEPNNLNRQLLYDEASLDLPKAFLAARRIRSLNSCTEVTPRRERLTEDNVESLLAEADIVVDALDNWEARLVLDNYTRRTGKPLVHAAVERHYGQAMLIIPGKTPGLQAIAPRSPGRSCVQVLGPVVGIVASIESLLALEAALGNYSRAGTLYVIDARTMDITSIRLQGPG